MHYMRKKTPLSFIIKICNITESLYIVQRSSFYSNPSYNSTVTHQSHPIRIVISLNFLPLWKNRKMPLTFIFGLGDTHHQNCKSLTKSKISLKMGNKLSDIWRSEHLQRFGGRFVS